MSELQMSDAITDGVLSPTHWKKMSPAEHERMLCRAAGFGIFLCLRKRRLASTIYMELQGLEAEWDWIPTPFPGDLIRHPYKAWGGHDYVYDPVKEAKYLARREVAITKREIAITKQRKMAGLVLEKKRRREVKEDAHRTFQRGQRCTCEYCR